jgi:hypothetical protein
VLKVNTPLPASMTQRAFEAGVVNQDAAHRLSGGGEEMRAVCEFRIFPADQTHPGFVNQCRGLEGLTGRFIRHLVRRQFAQFLIHQREQFLGGVGSRPRYYPIVPSRARQLALWVKCVAVVDDQIGPGDQTGFVRCQIQNRERDLFRFGKPSPLFHGASVKAAKGVHLVALVDDAVVGWCDITPMNDAVDSSENPEVPAR